MSLPISLMGSIWVSTVSWQGIFLQFRVFNGKKVIWGFETVNRPNYVHGHIARSWDAGNSLKTLSYVGLAYSACDTILLNPLRLYFLYIISSGVTRGVGARGQSILMAPPKNFFSRSKT